MLDEDIDRWHGDILEGRERFLLLPLLLRELLKAIAQAADVTFTFGRNDSHLLQQVAEPLRGRGQFIHEVTNADCVRRIRLPAAPDFASPKSG